MYDALAVLQAQVTKTAAFTGTGYDLKTNTPTRGIKVRLRVSDYGATATGAVITAFVDESSDNTTFNRLTDFAGLTAGTAAAVSQQFRTVQTNKRYIRGGIELSVTTGAPSIAYTMEIGGEGLN